MTEGPFLLLKRGAPGLNPQPPPSGMDERLIRYVTGRSSHEEVCAVENWMRDDPSNEAYIRSLRATWEKTEPLAREAQETAVPITRLLRLGEARDSHGLERSVGRGEARSRGTPLAWRPPQGFLPRWMQVAAAALLVVGGGVVGAGLGISGGSPAFGLEEIRTVTGERATAQLADGTVIRLAPQSVLRFTPGTPDREVWLEGRAFFSVLHDPDRPFRVRTPAGEATVLGTRFDMQVQPEGIQVAVVEGVVAMDAGPGQIRVEAGQVGRMTPTHGVEVEASEDILARLDWLGEFMAFERTPLMQVAREVERLYGRRVSVVGDEMAARTVTGAYEGRTFEQTLEAICLVVGAHCQIGESGAVIQP